jgi:phosphoribosylaminoimidazole carboxylase PurE protein
MTQPLVGIVLGSDSDLPLGRQAEKVLAEFGVASELTIASAHRTPERASRYAREARARGIKVIIAVAGLAAHLPGVLAAHTTLPVIGVPVAVGTLGGVDALLSMAQMPSGIPVATVGIGAAKNAALLALPVWQRLTRIWASA